MKALQKAKSNMQLIILANVQTTPRNNSSGGLFIDHVFQCLDSLGINIIDIFSHIMVTLS